MAAAQTPPRSDPLDSRRPAGVRVLWLTTGAETDGPGRALLAVLNRWSSTDAVAVCGLRQVSAAFRAECRQGILTQGFGMRGAWDVAAIVRLAQFCRRWRPDVIHTQLSRADWIGRPLGRALGVPVISTIHNVHSRMYRGEFSPALAELGLLCDRITAPWATRFVAVSAGVRRDLEAHGVAGSRISTIHNGLNLDRRSPAAPREVVRREWHVSSDHIVVGTVALFKAQKGLEFLVDAAAIVAAANPHVRFVHVGDGPLAEDIARRIELAGVSDRFRLVGRVADPLRLLSGFDMFVLPSLWEGLPIALLEGMSAGLPPIGTSVAGIEEVIEHNRSGLLVPPSDAGALAHAMLRLAADPAMRRLLGDGATRRIAQQFSSDAIAAAYRAVTLDVIGVHGRAPSGGGVIEPPNVRKASNM
jgi:glycosyltransferase involved in cell wall biosynthesis